MPSPNWDDFDGDLPEQDIPYALLELEGRTLELRSCFIGPAAPADPVDGQLWIQNDEIPWKPWFYGKLDAGEAVATWHSLVGRLTVSINADPDPADGRASPLEHLALRVENVDELPAAENTNRGLLELLTGDGELYVSEKQVSGDWKGLLSCRVDGNGFDTVEVPLESDFGNDGVNPPTRDSEGTIEGWLFDGVLEARTVKFQIPKNYDGVSPVQVRVWQILKANETAGDDIEWTSSYVVLPPAAGKASQTPTVLLANPTDIGADVDGIAAGGGPHVSVFELQPDDADNPLSAGSLVALTMNRVTVGGAGKVAGVIVFLVELAFPQRPRHERA
jgi:hypothetical protein